MCIRKIIFFWLFAGILLSILGCPRAEIAEIPAIIVFDSVPVRVNKSLYEKYILGNNIIKQNKKKEKDLLEKLYSLDEKEDAYVASLDEIDNNREDLLDIFRSIDYAPLFTDPNSEEFDTMVTEWDEIVCLTPRDNPKIVKIKDITGKEFSMEWYNIKVNGREGWILSDYLLFKSFKETEAVAIKDLGLYSVPICYAGRKIRSCPRGLTINLLGYEYYGRNCPGTQQYRLFAKVYEDYGWCYEPYILRNAHIGVILPDEVTLYNAPEARKENLVKSLVYKKMEVVPILEMLQGDKWYKVIYDNKTDIYYIKDDLVEGMHIISSNKDDIFFADWVFDLYIKSKEIIDAVEKVRDIKYSVSSIENKEDKIDILKSTLEEIEVKKKEYPNSVFSGDGTYSLKEFSDKLENILEALEEALFQEKTGGANQNNADSTGDKQTTGDDEDIQTFKTEDD